MKVWIVMYHEHNGSAGSDILAVCASEELGRKAMDVLAKKTWGDVALFYPEEYGGCWRNGEFGSHCITLREEEVIER